MDAFYGVRLAVADTPAAAVAMFAVEHGNPILVFIEAQCPIRTDLFTNAALIAFIFIEQRDDRRQIGHGIFALPLPEILEFIGDTALEIFCGLIPLPIHEIIQAVDTLLEHAYPS